MNRRRRYKGKRKRAALRLVRYKFDGETYSKVETKYLVSIGVVEEWPNIEVDDDGENYETA